MDSLTFRVPCGAVSFYYLEERTLKMRRMTPASRRVSGGQEGRKPKTIDSSSVEEFLSEFVNKAPFTKHGDKRSSVEAVALYRKYRGWAENGDKLPVSRHQFKKILLSLGFEQGRPENRIEWYVSVKDKI